MIQGQSDYTLEKQRVFWTIAATHMQIVRSKLRAWPGSYPRYAYIDLNAGSGYNTEAGIWGSPTIAAAIGDRLNLPLDLTLFEADLARRQELAARLSGRDDVHIYGDHAAEWRYIAAWYRGARQTVLGLVYFDPNAALIPIDVINGLVVKPLDKVDVLLHINANGGYKRPRGRGHAEYQGRYLADDVAKLDKRHWWIRKPKTDWQWTFLIGSNWAGFPEFRKQEFYPLASEIGQQVIEGLSLSERERKEQLARLPFALQPTELTPSICAIPASAPSGPPPSRGPAASASDAGAARQLSLIT